MRIEHVECGGDSIKVSYAADEPRAIKLTADGMAVAVIAQRVRRGRRRGPRHGLPRPEVARRLGIDVKGAAAPVEVKLP